MKPKTPGRESSINNTEEVEGEREIESYHANEEGTQWMRLVSETLERDPYMQIEGDQETPQEILRILWDDKEGAKSRLSLSRNPRSKRRRFRLDFTQGLKAFNIPSIREIRFNKSEGWIQFVCKNPKDIETESAVIYRDGEFYSFPTTIGLDLSISLEDIKPTFPCIACQGQGERHLVNWEIDFTNKEGFKQFICTAVPGYKCTSCTTEAYHPDGSIKALEESLKTLKQEDSDQETIEQVQASLDTAYRRRGYFT